ncbi:MAG: hypothetical protein Q9M36_05730 [Sulfurovum sp.]|nr:hypothetical protein [Sulfurovum sp.]
MLKLNPKTAGIITSSRGEWRVPYSMLSKIIDIEGEVVVDRFIGDVSVR